MADKKKFSSHDLPDVGEAVCSWAHDFDFPNYEVPQDPGKGDNDEHAVDSYFSGSRPNSRG